MRLLVLISFGMHHTEGADGIDAWVLIQMRELFLGGVWCGILWLANDVDNSNDDNVLQNSDGDGDGYRGGVMELNGIILLNRRGSRLQWVLL